MESARLDALENRRLLAFATAGASTLTGTEYQSVDAIVAVDGGYVAAGTFSAGADFGNGFKPSPRGYSDIFLTLVRDSGSSVYTIGGGSKDDGEVKTRDGRAQFVALPRRLSEEYPLGVSSGTRRQDEYVSAMKVGPDGKLYVVFLYRQDISLNTQNRRGFRLAADDQYDLYDSAIVRYSIGKKLAFETAFTLTGPFNDIVHDIDFDSAGNVVVAGSFERLADFDPSSGTKLMNPLGRSDAFVAKYTADGELIYVSQFGSDAADLFEPEAAYGVAVDASDNIYVGGVFAGKADFDPRAGKTNRHWVEADDFTDGFTLKLNPNGTLNWVRAQGGEDFDGIRDVALAPGGGVYSVGYFEDEADVDPTSGVQIFKARPEDGDNNPYATDLFSNRFDADGNLLWVKPLAGDGYELLANAQSDAGGNLVLTGSFFGTADFDPSRRQRILRTPEADTDDQNQRDRENAYSGFIARYSPNAKLLDVTQVDGRAQQDVFLNAGAIDANGNVLTAGRYRLGLIADSITIGTGTDPDDDEVMESGFALVFGSGLAPIV